ncbi:MAG: NAD-dependent epimerase/dehydratase family protein [Planctomycetes bacterium]|nr:NAD-dependent epimerase/dehydratase family protein [Planctomycetota bacterium]
MRILVTGATGFVGGPTLRALQREGHQIRALVRDRSRAQTLLSRADEVVDGELRDPASLARACAGIDAVVHVAGLTKALRSEDFDAVNVRGTKHLCEAARDAGVGRFVLISSLAAAGASAPGSPRTPDAPPFPVSAYGRSKLGGERSAAAILTNTSVKLTILRPPIVYGEGDPDLLVVFQQCRRGVLPVVGGAKSLQITYSLVHVDDLARGIAQAASAGAACGNVYSLPGPRDATLLQIIQGVESAVGRRARRIPLPFALAKPAAWLAQTSLRAAGRASIVNLDKLREMEAGDWTCSGESARRDFQYSPAIDLEAGLARQAQWARAKGLL